MQASQYSPYAIPERTIPLNSDFFHIYQCAIHRAICIIQHLQSFGILTLIHVSIWWMWNNFQSFICEKERIWDKGTKTVHNHSMQHYIVIIPWGISHRLCNILQGFCWIMSPLHLKKISKLW
jgi:hypothetical protein